MLVGDIPLRPARSVRVPTYSRRADWQHSDLSESAWLAGFHRSPAAMGGPFTYVGHGGYFLS